MNVKVSSISLIHGAEMDLNILGFNKYFQKKFKKHGGEAGIPGRVVSQSRKSYTVESAEGSSDATLSGKFIYDTPDRSDWPAVGDWVILSIKGDKALIVSILPRKSCFSRRKSGNIVEKQVISANVDVIFIVMSLDYNYNLSRLQRYISSSISSGAQPVILLNKADICDDSEVKRAEVDNIARGVPVHLVSSKWADRTYDVISDYLKRGVTGVFTGSSGVGKSTLINILLGESRLKTGAISSTIKKGRHTTSSRDLIVLDAGGMVIDTPGMRELQLWELEESVGFEKIRELSQKCRFSDCSHLSEPDCAVIEAVRNGNLDSSSLETWRKHLEEVKELEKQKERSKKILALKNAKTHRK
jgi:ribosome biogenesis GTPase